MSARPLVYAVINCALQGLRLLIPPEMELEVSGDGVMLTSPDSFEWTDLGLAAVHEDPKALEECLQELLDIVQSFVIDELRSAWPVVEGRNGDRHLQARVHFDGSEFLLYYGDLEEEACLVVCRCGFQA